MADRIKQTAQEELLAARDIAKAGVVSGSYVYPIKGVYN